MLPNVPAVEDAPTRMRMTPHGLHLLDIVGVAIENFSRTAPASETSPAARIQHILGSAWHEVQAVLDE